MIFLMTSEDLFDTSTDILLYCLRIDRYLRKDSLPQMAISFSDFSWLMLLVCFCTVYAYAQYIELLKRLSVFTIHLAYNLEPVYGMIFAAFFFKEHHLFGPLFYCGAAIIFISVIIHPFFEKKGKQAH